MDILSWSRSARGTELVQEWNERVTVLSAAPGASPEALPDLAKVLMELFPIIAQLLIGGFTPLALLTLIPTIIKIVFPNLDAGLVAILMQILEFIIKR